MTNNFFVTKVLLQQAYFCGDKRLIFCDKHVFVTTKLLSPQELYLWQLPPVICQFSCSHKKCIWLKCVGAKGLERGCVWVYVCVCVCERECKTTWQLFAHFEDELILMDFVTSITCRMITMQSELTHTLTNPFSFFSSRHGCNLLL